MNLKKCTSLFLSYKTNDFKCECGLIIQCFNQNRQECLDQCKIACSSFGPGGISYQPYGENTLGPMDDSYPPSVKKLWDDIVYNQPEGYNYTLANSNQVNFTNAQQGLTHDHFMPATEWR